MIDLDDDYSEFDCVKCGINTLIIGEYYMLLDDVWDMAGVENGMLCVSCFEFLSGIRLKSEHFADFAINRMSLRRSDVLNDRIFSNARS
jgi:hypothetical protein